MKMPRQLLVTQPGMTERGPTVDVLDARGDPILTVARFFGETAEADALLFAGADALLSALTKATQELNAIRARDGAPQHIDWFRGNPIQTDSCTHEYWNALTEECYAALAQAAPTPAADRGEG